MIKKKSAVHLGKKMISKTLIWEKNGDFQVWVQFWSVLRRHGVSVMTSASVSVMNIPLKSKKNNNILEGKTA